MLSAGCSGLTSITIPNSVTSIGESAFKGCKKISSINIPNSVTSIGKDAFSVCPSLTSITIGMAFTSIQELGCSNITSANLLDGITCIGYKAFYGCPMTSIIIPNSVTSIGNKAFYGCPMTSITIPNSVTSIGDEAFSHCTKLISITIPNSVTSIGVDAFAYCTKLASITIPNSVTKIGGGAFHGTKWFENQPTGLVYLGAFLYRCTNYYYTKVEIKEGTKGLAGLAFQGCNDLTSVIIPNSVTNIGDYAFYGCTKLTSASIPSSVTSIGDYAFYDCKSLTSVTIPNSITSVGRAAFSGCSGLTGPVIIPNTMTSIENEVFYNCKGLTSITLPNSVTSIGGSAFYGCSGLKGSISVPNSVTSIGHTAFYNCSGIKEICSWNTIPPSAYNDSFTGMNTMHAKVYVPEGAIDAYKYAMGWMDFQNIYEMEYSSVLSEAEPITISDGAPDVKKGYYKEKTMTYVREGNAISKDNYASFCLPFAVDPTDAQFKAVYLPVGLALYNTEKNTLRIGFYKSNEMIPAGTPFVAQLAVDDKVEIKNALPVNYDSNSSIVKKVINTFNYSDFGGLMNKNNDYAINISGTYKKDSPSKAYNFNTDGSIGTATSVAPFRAYVVITQNSTNAKILTSFDEDSDVTGIIELRMPNDKLPVYDLNGRAVNENGLKSGIYIKNKKKVVVK